MKPWTVIQSPTDSEMWAVECEYLVADNLPIEDAQMIAAAPDLYDAIGNLTIGIGMGWDLDGLVAVARSAIAKAIVS